MLLHAMQQLLFKKNISYMGIFGPSDPLYNHTKAPSALCGTPHLMRACFTAVNF